MPMPSMGAMFLVPTGIISALIAREATGRGQHVRTSLFQGALLYTTQIWSRAPGDQRRSCRQRVRALVDHERLGHGEVAGRAPRAARPVGSGALHAVVA